MKKKIELALEVVSGLIIVASCIATITFFSYAWFKSKQEVDFSANNISVFGGASFSLKEYKYDQINSKHYVYDYENKNSILDVNYDTDFVSIGNSVSVSKIYPKDCLTFAVEITNSLNSKVIVNLDSFKTSIIDGLFYKDQTKTIPLEYIDLKNAIDITFYNIGNDKTKALSFINGTEIPLALDAFNDTFTGDFDINEINNVRNYSYKTNGINNLYETTLTNLDFSIILFSISFSNKEATYFSYDDTDPLNPFYYLDSVNGDSNIYQNTSISLNNLTFKIG